MTTKTQDPFLDNYVSEALRRLRISPSRGLAFRLPEFDGLPEEAAEIVRRVNHLHSLVAEQRQRVTDLNAELTTYRRGGRADELARAIEQGIDPPDDKTPRFEADIAEAQRLAQQYVSIQNGMIEELRPYLGAVPAAAEVLDDRVRKTLSKVVPTLAKVRDTLTDLRDDVAMIRWAKVPGKTMPSGMEWAAEKSVREALEVIEKLIEE
jgi:hypothetical protein